MKTLFRALILVSMLAAGLAPVQAQTISANKILIFSPTAPPPVTIATVNQSQPGPASYWYWVVTYSASGEAAIGGPFSVTNAPAALSASAYITVVWRPVSGATSYDLLRTAPGTVPTGACNCAVVTGTILAFALDKSGTLLSYTLPTIAPPAGQSGYVLKSGGPSGYDTWAPGDGMVYPAAGVANSTGAAWGTSYGVGIGDSDLVQLTAGGLLPAVSAANLIDFPTLNQNTTGNAASVGGITVTGTPSPGQVLTATGATAGDWQASASGPVVELNARYSGGQAPGAVYTAATETAGVYRVSVAFVNESTGSVTPYLVAQVPLSGSSGEYTVSTIPNTAVGSFATSYAVTFFYALAGTEAFTVTFASNTIPADCYYAVYIERMF
ncbi:MAG: hypothetical protein ACRD04_14635 [Terriglobales bacterium]